MTRRKRAYAGRTNKATVVSKNSIDTELQAGARSAQSYALNYNSVTTIDPTRLAQAFAAADQGFISEQAALFEMIEEQDPHIFSELSKRRGAITGLGWQLTPHDDASQSEVDRTKELSDILTNIPNFEGAQFDLTDAIGKGFTPIEIDWQTGETWYPKELIFVPQRMFRINRDTNKLQYLNNGIPEDLRQYGWVVHEHRAKSGYIEQAALFRVLAWTYAYKAYDVKDMQRFLETYGMPLRLGKYPAGTQKAQRDELIKAVRNIGNDGAGVVPATMTIDFLQAVGGKVTDFLEAINYWERKQSIAILGGTLTSQADGKTSTNALGVVHDKVLRRIMLHDVGQITPTMNRQIVRPIALINGIFPEDRIPTFGYQTEETVDQSKMVDVLIKGAESGMEIDVDYAHKVMQIPRAKEGAKILTIRQRPPVSPANDSTALSRLAALIGNKTKAPDDIISAYTAQLTKLCAPHEQELINDISAILAQTGDFDAAIDALSALRAANPQWPEDLAWGMAAAHLAGRFDIHQEN